MSVRGEQQQAVDTYDRCPRGAGDREAHRRKMLVHRMVGGRLSCMWLELAIDYDRALLEAERGVGGVSLDELVSAILAATEAPPPPERIEVARDLYDRMRRAAEPVVGCRPTISSAFGIPVAIDDGLSDGEWRIVERPGGVS